MGLFEIEPCKCGGNRWRLRYDTQDRTHQVRTFVCLFCGREVVAVRERTDDDA